MINVTGAEVASASDVVQLVAKDAVSTGRQDVSKNHGTGNDVNSRGGGVVRVTLPVLSTHKVLRCPLYVAALAFVPTVGTGMSQCRQLRAKGTLPPHPWHSVLCPGPHTPLPPTPMPRPSSASPASSPASPSPACPSSSKPPASPSAISMTSSSPARTLKHRRAQRSPLSPDESGKLARLARIFDQATVVLGDAQSAREWLTQPKNASATAPPSTCSVPKSAAAWSRRYSARPTKACSPEGIPLRWSQQIADDRFT